MSNGEQQDEGPSRHEHFDIFRRYANHEDSLINQRLSWNLTIQGFLFATYGWTMQKLVELLANPNANRTLSLPALPCLLIALCVLGCLISSLTEVGINAAQMAIKELEKRWQDIEAEYKERARAKGIKLPGLPGFTGGGASEAHKLGFRAPLKFPRIFIWIWAALLVISLAFFFLYLWRLLLH